MCPSIILVTCPTIHNLYDAAQFYISFNELALQLYLWDACNWMNAQLLHASLMCASSHHFLLSAAATNPIMQLMTINIKGSDRPIPSAPTCQSAAPWRSWPAPCIVLMLENIHGWVGLAEDGVTSVRESHTVGIAALHANHNLLIYAKSAWWTRCSNAVVCVHWSKHACLHNPLPPVHPTWALQWHAPWLNATSWSENYCALWLDPWPSANSPPDDSNIQVMKISWMIAGCVDAEDLIVVSC